MTEEFLHYLWKFKKFDTLNLRTTSGDEITIVHSGQYLEQAGPDFFNAQIIVGNQKWAGNVEIHIKSSDWYIHKHEIDSAYENVILHVVWQHDVEIFRKNNVEIPVLELRQYVPAELVAGYESLRTIKSWIFCENQLKDIDHFVLKNWQERLFLERLEKKSEPILELANATNKDWEAVLFCLLAKNFGLNTNGTIFLDIAKSIPFNIIQKEHFEIENLEALFLGNANLLDSDKEDTYFKDLQFRFQYLLHKYQLVRPVIEPVQFFKHRPDNFPTIRLVQLAALYSNEINLFSKIISAPTVSEIYTIFQKTTSSYWQNHYLFDKESPKKNKTISKSFIDLIIINTILPIRFVYAQSQGKENIEELMKLLYEIKPEKNVIIDKFSTFGLKSQNAYETQALLQLKNAYCNKSKCLDCAIGIKLVRNN